MTLPALEREGPGHEPVADEEAAAAYAETLGRAVHVGEQLKEGPCVPPHWLARILTESGRECPRVVLMPQNYIAAELVALLFKEETRDAFWPLFDAHLGAASREERVSVMRRVIAAINSPEVQRRLHPPPPPKPPSRRH